MEHFVLDENSDARSSTQSALQQAELGTQSHLGWRRSSKCGHNGSCVEFAEMANGKIALRDGKAPQTSPILVFTAQEWTSFVAGVRAGDFG